MSFSRISSVYIWNILNVLLVSRYYSFLFFLLQNERSDMMKMKHCKMVCWATHTVNNFCFFFFYSRWLYLSNIETFIFEMKVTNEYESVVSSIYCCYLWRFFLSKPTQSIVSIMINMLIGWKRIIFSLLSLLYHCNSNRHQRRNSEKV